MLAIATQPASSATVGVALDPQPVIQLRAASGADLATAGVAVSVAIATGGGTLSGTTTVSTDGQGRAAFTDLAINGDPGTRTLVFTAPGYGSATSGDIAVQAAPPAPPDASQSTLTVNPASVAIGATSTITVTVRDAGGNPLAGRSVTRGRLGDEQHDHRESRHDRSRRRRDLRLQLDDRRIEDGHGHARTGSPWGAADDRSDPVTLRASAAAAAGLACHAGVPSVNSRSQVPGD